MDFDVIPEFKRSKIGSRMMEQVKELAKSKDEILSISLHVWVKNQSAIDFYKKQGFEIIQIIKEYYANYPDAEKSAYLCELFI